MKNLMFWIGASLMILPIFYIIYLKFSNVDITDLRFALTYWYVYIPSFIIIILGAVLIKKSGV